MTAGRPWRVDRPLKLQAYQRIRGNVTFDDYASTFRLETEAEARRFAKRFKGAVVRRHGRGDGGRTPRGAG